MDPDHRTQRHKWKLFADAERVTGATRYPHHVLRLEVLHGLYQAKPTPKGSPLFGATSGPVGHSVPHRNTGALAHLALSQIPTTGYYSVFHGWVSVRCLYAAKAGDRRNRGELSRTNRRGHPTLTLGFWVFYYVQAL